ncbi:hypothetical protein DRO97_01925 [Archaeoglobales archaeon]|nr:MAG: hypothetical protein DRO97_01925 [Archaeoglobales archaeon]
MLNYGEELAYWYLRLNGFFIISNFVLHTENKTMRGDADLLAIRLPGTVEYIGRREVSFDDEGLFEYIDKNKIVGVIAEVKAGFKNSSDKLNIFTDKNKLKKALHRLGMYEEGDEEDTRYKKERNGYQVLKVLFKNINSDIDIENDEYLVIPLHYAEKFIKDRLKENDVEKLGSWVFFPSNLFQLLIWQIKFDSNSI